MDIPCFLLLCNCIWAVNLVGFLLPVTRGGGVLKFVNLLIFYYASLLYLYTNQWLVSFELLKLFIESWFSYLGSLTSSLWFFIESNSFSGSDKGYFVDLFVRASNTPAIKMYEKVWPVGSLFFSYLDYMNAVTKQTFGVQWRCSYHIDGFLFQLGYVIYRRVLRYYSGEEDGLGECLHLTVAFWPFYFRFMLPPTYLYLNQFQIWERPYPVM